MTDPFETVKVGDFVRGYEKGIHIVEDITPGCGSGKCFHLRRLLTSNYQTGKGKSTCDGPWITPVSKKDLKKEIQGYMKEALANVERYL